jgi:hypothetical protein
LRAAEVPLGCLHRDLAEEKLDLLQLAASGTAESSATSAPIMRRELAYAYIRRELLDEVPDELLGDPLAPNLASAAYAAEQVSTGNSGGLHPVAQEIPHPIGDGDGPSVTSLPAHIYDRPMPFALLEVIDCQTSEFVTPKPAC